VTTVATVLQEGDGPPELCLGGVAESFPPQCGGPEIAGWDWEDGMRPGPQAPVWPMNAFRDRFLSAFGSQPAAG
jgi:hypothetical protein